MKNIANHIKNNEYKSVYLLFGEEEYLKKMYRDKLRLAIVGEGANMNFNYFEGKETAPEKIIEISETSPFFAEKRLIMIENSGYFKSGCEEITEYVENIPDTTCMVFVEKEADKRGRLYKRVKDKGYVCEINYQTESVLTKWVLGKLSADNKKIKKETMELFLSCTGLDMTNIDNELNKLLSYTMGRDVITDEDVLEIVSAKISGKIFDMIDAISEKNTKKAMDLYYDLIATKEPPMRILYMLARQFNIMIKVKELSGCGYSRNEVAEMAGIQSFVAGKVISRIDRFSMASLMAALNDCVETEEYIKNGRLDEMSGVEMLIIKYSK